VLHVLAGGLDQFTPVAHQNTHRTNVRFRPESPTQQTYGMQILKPLTFVPIRTPSRHVLHVPRIH
jgi:hypothetical protein